MKRNSKMTIMYACAPRKMPHVKRFHWPLLALSKTKHWTKAWYSTWPNLLGKPVWVISSRILYCSMKYFSPGSFQCSVLHADRKNVSEDFINLCVNETWKSVQRTIKFALEWASLKVAFSEIEVLFASGASGCHAGGRGFEPRPDQHSGS